MNKKYICHVCGYDGLNEEPWGEDGKIPSRDICSCCGVEFGYEDCNENSIFKYRENWISKGCKWFDESEKPVDWNLKDQLGNIGIDI